MLLKFVLCGIGRCMIKEFIWKEGVEAVDEKSELLDIETILSDS